MMLHSNVIVKFLNEAELITNRLTILTLTKCASKCFKIKIKHPRTTIQNEDKNKIKNKRDILHRLRNKRIERERERHTHTHTQTHAQSIPCAWRLWSYSYRRCTEPLPGKAEGRPWHAPLPRKDLLKPQEPSPLWASAINSSFRQRRELWLLQNDFNASDQLFGWNRALYMRKSLQISKRKQKKFHCERERERERNTIEARKTSSHPTSLPIEVPSRDPIIRSYNEVSCEISEWVSYWDLKTMSPKHWDLKSVVLFHHGTVLVDDVLPQLKIPLNFGEPFFRVRRFSKQKS
jgi:hypothetical protein